MGNTCKNYTKEDEENISISKDDSPRDTIKNKNIEILKIKIMNIPLFQRKAIAKEKYNKIINKRNKKKIIVNNDNFIEEYLSIIELLLLNNTDKDIVSLYLNFINKYDIYVKKYNFKTFENEIETYKLVLSIKETENIKKGIKSQSTKDILINFLIELSSIRDISNAR